ncbi:MAG: hypothetical protein WCJ39_05370 [bacterium]
MKKNIYTLLSIFATIASTCTIPAHGQTVGVGEVIYSSPQNESLTGEVQQKTSYMISIQAIHQHLFLANISQEIPQQGSLLLHLKTVDLLVQTDILQDMEVSTDKQDTLQKYLQECEKAINESQIDISYLEQTLPLLKIDMNTCISNKNAADTQYFKSINRYDSQESDLVLQQSIANDRCASEKRIQYNAKSYLLSKLSFYTSTLQAKQKLLSDEQDMIINHLESIKTDILQKLTDINAMLQSYTF